MKKPQVTAVKVLKVLDQINESNMDIPTTLQLEKELEKYTELLKESKTVDDVVVAYPADDGNLEAFESKVWASPRLKLAYIGKSADGGYQFTTSEKISKDAAAAAEAAL